MSKTETENLPVVYDLGADAGIGTDDIGTDDIKIPFLGVVQDKSKPLKSGAPGVAVGKLFNSVTREVFDGTTGVVIVPVMQKHEFIEWVPLAKGGGYVGAHAKDSEIVAKAKAESMKWGEYFTDSKNELVETRSLFVIVLDEETMEPEGFAVVAFKSTQIGVLTAVNTRLKMFMVPTATGKRRPAIFQHTMRLTTWHDTSKPAGEFEAYALTFLNDDKPRKSLLDLDSETYLAAKSLREALEGGAATADYDSADGGADGASEPDDFC